MMGKDKSIRSQMSVNEVAGLLDVKEIKNILQEKCKAETTAIDGSCELPHPPCRNPLRNRRRYMGYAWELQTDIGV
jgi:hypothetical protein